MILFLCAGNTCRSPLAQYLAKAEGKKRGLSSEFSSAGLYAFPGDEMSGGSFRALKRRGIDGGKFRSRSLSPYLLEEAELIVPMTKGIAADVRASYPEAESKLYLFWERGGREVPDPYGGSDALYEETAKTIEDDIQVLFSDPEVIL